MAGLNTSEYKPPTLLNDGLAPFPVEQPEALVPHPVDRIVFVVIDIDEYAAGPIPQVPESQPFDWRIALAEMRHKFALDGHRGVLLTSIALGTAVLTFGGVRSFFAERPAETPVVSVNRTETAPQPQPLPVSTVPEAVPEKVSEDAPPVAAIAATPQPRGPARSPRAPISTAAAPAAFRGHLVVDSIPQGAMVFINQQEVGVTPLSLPQHPAGSYAIWVQGEGYQRWTAGVLVPASKTTRITAKLESPR